LQKNNNQVKGVFRVTKFQDISICKAYARNSLN
jgi:hypothetical protein